MTPNPKKKSELFDIRCTCGEEWTVQLGPEPVAFECDCGRAYRDVKRTTTGTMYTVNTWMDDHETLDWSPERLYAMLADEGLIK